MKRILLSVFAAAITAAWALPADAADVSLSGQYRLRGEYRNNTDFNDNAGDSTNSWGQRVRLTANAKATDDTSVKITLQDTRTWGSGGTAGLLTDSGQAIDAHEAYVNITNLFGTPVALRAGRQELAYGDERLIGAFGWSNQGRAFEALKFTYSTDAVNVDLFDAKVVENTTNDSDTDLYGVYATLKQLVPNHTLDVYLLDKVEQASKTNRYTIGARLKGATAGVDYTAELPFQSGTNDSNPNASVDLNAWAFAGKVGYNVPSAMKVRVGAEFDYATGDDSQTTSENEAFDQLYPTNHAHFGYADVTGANQWSDIMAWSLNVGADLNEKTRAYAAYWSYTEVETAANADDQIGSEIDITVTHKYSNAVSLEAGVSRFFVGDALARNGDDQDWAYIMLTANF